MSATKLCWLDIRQCGPAASAVAEEAIHQRVDGIVAADPATLAGLPPTVMKILVVEHAPKPETLDGIDVLILPYGARHDAVAAGLATSHPQLQVGTFVEITDAESLEQACIVARTHRWSLLSFLDSTKIPLEIVLAAAAGTSGTIITVAADPTEARIVFGVLEIGSDGVMLAARAVGDATALKAAASQATNDLALVELLVTGTTHVGMGDRACVDTCSYLSQGEGLLVGSHSKGLMLCVSETHPLPYMPTRPFRVNAGAIHSYTLAAAGRTHYLSELRSGDEVLAVDVKGQTRLVTVGRVKIERRPLLSVDAEAPDGQRVNLILQDDWHVRLLGPAATVLHCTDLLPGDRILGYLPNADRHVGYPIDEFCIEQ